MEITVMNLTAKQQSPISFEQYVSGKFDCPWSDCRWVEGALVQVPLESGQNNAIALDQPHTRHLYGRSPNCLARGPFSLPQRVPKAFLKTTLLSQIRPLSVIAGLALHSPRPCRRPDH